MLRVHKSILVSGSPTNENAIYYIEGACIGDDIDGLPTDGIAMGSKIYVVDDKETIYFNEETSLWDGQNADSGNPGEK